ncbi:hypothetical protein GCM10023065_07400 [Microbacterium laevaniformans]|uniref:hypothetical protein n=1 Tax=Microbacterium laevaniformans TaxID=36807 RepID=UPI00195A4A34|nr:hypothetical protein [Microbacterium laevaniformans]MBM7751692.1 hypothetical protein [Microbacterium laevaniformans]GLJ63957.1 hypothetical protein GCM10017578_08450 [Microbacterium laevaniformans]
MTPTPTPTPEPTPVLPDGAPGSTVTVKFGDVERARVTLSAEGTAEVTIEGTVLDFWFTKISIAYMAGAAGPATVTDIWRLVG